MQGIDVLYWALSIVFCLALLFAILLWCRGWRREEQEASTRQMQLLAREVKRLAESVEALDQTAASLQTADEQLTRHVESLRDAVRDLRRRQNALPERPMPGRVAAPAPALQKAPVSKTTQDGPEAGEADDEDRYDQARALLKSGRDPVEVARQLDLGTAEVKMIARLLQTPDADA